MTLQSELCQAWVWTIPCTLPNDVARKPWCDAAAPRCITCALAPTPPPPFLPFPPSSPSAHGCEHGAVRVCNLCVALHMLSPLLQTRGLASPGLLVPVMSRAVSPMLDLQNLALAPRVGARRDQKYGFVAGSRDHAQPADCNQPRAPEPSLSAQGSSGLNSFLSRAVPFMRDRLIADPRYCFIVLAEVAIDTGCATVAEARLTSHAFLVATDEQCRQPLYVVSSAGWTGEKACLSVCPA